jgi:hypothetical protein
MSIGGQTSGKHLLPLEMGVELLVSDDSDGDRHTTEVRLPSRKGGGRHELDILNS